KSRRQYRRRPKAAATAPPEQRGARLEPAGSVQRHERSRRDDRRRAERREGAHAKRDQSAAALEARARRAKPRQALAGARREHEREADARQHEREAEAEGDDQQQAEADAVQTDRAQHDDDRRGAREQAAEYAEADEPAPGDGHAVLPRDRVRVRPPEA